MQFAARLKTQAVRMHDNTSSKLLFGTCCAVQLMRLHKHSAAILAICVPGLQRFSS